MTSDAGAPHDVDCEPDDATTNRRAGRQSAEAAAQTQRAILAAALSVFATQGYDGASLRDIAERAGTTHGLIRHHYGTKERLWQAVVNDAASRYAAALEPYAPQANGAPADVVSTARAGIASFVRVAAAHPEIIRLLMHEGAQGGPPLVYALEQYAPLGERMAPLLAQLHALGRLRQFDNRTFFLFVLLAGCGPFALAPLSEWLLGGDIRAAPAVEQQIARVLDTLLPLDAY